MLVVSVGIGAERAAGAPGAKAVRRELVEAVAEIAPREASLMSSVSMALLTLRGVASRSCEGAHNLPSVATNCALLPPA